jgi:hypothetical protein
VGNMLALVRCLLDDLCKRRLGVTLEYPFGELYTSRTKNSAATVSPSARIGSFNPVMTALKNGLPVS